MESCGQSALDRPAAELSVLDVYDIAALLGHEFERLIERFGCEAMVGVVPKVVRVLEQLETLVNYGGARHQAEELQLELDRLRQERSDRSEQERRHQMELELVEDMWRSEVQDLVSQISQLQNDNKRLLSQCESEGPATVEPLQPQGVPEKEREVLQKLKELVDKQRDELRSTEHELSLRNDDVEALQLQQKRVMKMNQELRHRLSVVEAQGKALVQGKAEMEAVAQARTQELGQLRREVSRLQRELQDLETHVSSETAAFAGSDPTVKTPSSVWVECAGDPQFLANCFEQEPKADCEETQPNLLTWDLSSVGNDTDSDGSESEAPHFTLQELRDVLYEKNQLKAQVFVLQEELAYYKQESDEDYSESVCGPYEDNTDSAAAAAEEEEPESGIRKLIFTAIMPMVAAGLISDDPTLMPIRRLVSIS